jgi:hypothetical protein
MVSAGQAGTRAFGKQGLLVAGSNEGSCSIGSSKKTSSSWISSGSAMGRIHNEAAAVVGPGGGLSNELMGAGGAATMGGASQEMIGPVTREDVVGALKATKPSARLYEAEYQAFSEKYGQIM